MLILGIDPGLRKTGWGIVESVGSRLSYVASGLICADPKASLPIRLAYLHENVMDVILTWRPESAAVEETFVNKNPASALKLGQARGVLLAVPALCGLETAEYSANTIKKSVTGAGHAAKMQVGAMIQMLLPGARAENGGQISEDEADALAVAITHAHHRQSMMRRVPATL